MIEVFADSAALAAAATGAVIAALEAGLRTHGSASLAATGGRAPGPIYDALSLVPLDWARVHITLTDERWVDPSSEDSNEKLVRERLLRGRAADARFIGLHGHEATPEAAAAAATAQVAALPPLDVVLLGMGEDGHVASLFPGSPALALGLDPKAPACIAVPQGQGRPPAQARLSMSIRPLTTAALVLILISGDKKRRVIEQALAGGDPEEFPVRAVLQSAHAVRILWTA